ncbi:MAG TPA: zinc ribbon domain-containing protein [Pyrinomonadaceae bacterium]|nr:zinc ribbon domain-containing protein [Pyrinomonadaceae bacterium]
MDVTCQRCGAGVPEGHAFCAECGAVVFEGAPRERREDPSALLASTISGAYALRDLEAAQPAQPATPKPPPSAAPPPGAARPAERHAPQATQPATPRKSSALLVAFGLAAVLALGGLLIYLVGLIMRG